MNKKWMKQWRTKMGISHMGQRYIVRNNARIGGIALCTRETVWTREGKVYQVISHKGKPAIIAEDGYPMPIHYDVSDRYFEFYRKYNLSVKQELQQLVKGVLAYGNTKTKSID